MESSWRSYNNKRNMKIHIKFNLWLKFSNTEYITKNESMNIIRLFQIGRSMDHHSWTSAWLGQSVEYIVSHHGSWVGFWHFSAPFYLHIMDVLQKHFLRPLQHCTLKSQNNIAWILIILRSKSNCIRVDTCT